MRAVWDWVRSHKLVTALGVTAGGGALAYAMRDHLRPLGDRLLAYGLEQQVKLMKDEARAQRRQDEYERSGESARESLFDYDILPEVERSCRRKLSSKSMKQDLKALRAAGGAASGGAETQRKLSEGIVVLHLAQAAAAIYSSALLITSLRAFLAVLLRHQAEHRLALSKSTRPDQDFLSGLDSLLGGTSTLEDADGGPAAPKTPDRATATSPPPDCEDSVLYDAKMREAVTTLAWNLLDKNHGAIMSRTKAVTADVVGRGEWSHTSPVSARDVGRILDCILGKLHASLFLPSSADRIDFSAAAQQIGKIDDDDYEMQRACRSILGECIVMAQW